MSPDIRLTTSALLDVVGADCLAVPVARGVDGPVLGAGATELSVAGAPDLAAVLHSESAKGEAGEIVMVPLPRPEGGVTPLLLTGVGDGSPAALRRAGAALARRTKGRSRLAATVVRDSGPDGLRAFVEALRLGAYRFDRRSAPRGPAPLQGVEIVISDAGVSEPPLRRASATADAVVLARDLANTPPAEKSPAWLADQAREVADGAGLGVEVWDERRLRAEGCGGILAVGMGSSRPPRLIRLAYEPDTADRVPHVVLVGKGITFDSGGLSLKPRDAMKLMKADMAGGAAVIAVMGALRDLGVPLRVTGLVAAAENLPSGSAYRPGDVVTQYGGTTVEVLNTDAEGRLVLADALAYADAALDPDVVVDVATLTGAATLGLGRRHAPLYATDDTLADELVAAGEASGDRVWRMPLVDDYRTALGSDIADLAHVSRDPHIQGGSITAALFLREFVGGRRWAHIDIAGTGKVEADEHEVTKGGTGFGVRLLLRWLEGF